MKIRQGFVSNSSSSSFVVIGKRVSLTDISLDDFKNKNWMIETGYYYEGTVNIQTKWFDKNQFEDLYNFMVNSGDVSDEFKRDYLIEVFEYGSDSGEMTVKAGRIPDTCDLTIFYGEEDQHSPSNMQEVHELVGEGDY